MSSDHKEILVDNILTTADKLFRTMLPTVPEALLSMDVTMPQLKIMLMLYFHGPMRMSAIASELNVTLPTATSLVDKLVDKNFVSRETRNEDRRVVICQVSEEGNTAIVNIWKSFRINCHKILAEVDTVQLKIFSEILNAMMKSEFFKQYSTENKNK